MPELDNPPVESQSLWQRVVAWTIYPVVMVGSIVTALLLLEHEVAGPIVVLGIVLVPSLLTIVLGECYLPYYRSWRHSHDDVPSDVAHTALITGVGVALQPVLAGTGAFFAGALSGLTDIGIWPKHWPMVFQLTAALLLVEFFQYWTHRIQHEQEWAWRFHALHHSAPRLYWLNAGRFHFVDPTMHKLTGHLPLIALGASMEVFILLEIFTLLSGVFQHANLATRLGPLSWIFSTSDLHRWHHSPVAAEANHNYGRNLIIWDLVFGTRFLPIGRMPPRKPGLEGMEAFPERFWAQLASPIEWQKIKRQSRALSFS